MERFPKCGYRGHDWQAVNGVLYEQDDYKELVVTRVSPDVIK